VFFIYGQFVCFAFVLCFWCIFGCLFCVVRTSVSDCLERFVSEMTYCVLSGTCNSTYLLTNILSCISVPLFPGLPGQAGAVGQTGPMGSPGMTGARGRQGGTGSRGATGVVGRPGDTGQTGTPGSVGK